MKKVLAPVAASILLAACSGATSDPEPSASTSTGPVDAQAQAARFGSCLREKGFDVTVNVGPDGVQRFEGDVPQDQRPALQAALKACNAQLGRPDGLDDFSGPHDGGEAPKEALSQFYDDLLTTHQCLADAGLPVEEPPTRQAFIDSGGDWDPIRQVMDNNGLPEAAQACMSSADPGNTTVEGQ